MDSIQINERAWKRILEQIHARLDDGSSQADVARLIGCDRATVNRWVLDLRGGERTSFKDMIRILDRLRIPLRDVFGTGETSLPAPSPDRSASGMDKAVASTLRAVAKAVGKDSAAIATELQSLEEQDIEVMLKGRSPMRVSDFIDICQAIGVAPGVVIDRAEKLSGK